MTETTRCLEGAGPTSRAGYRWNVSWKNQSGLPVGGEAGRETPGGGRSRRSRFPAGAAQKQVPPSLPHVEKEARNLPSAAEPAWTAGPLQKAIKRQLASGIALIHVRAPAKYQFGPDLISKK